MKEIEEKMSTLAIEFRLCRQIFIAMGDENRQHIIIALLEHYGGIRVGEIAKVTNLSRPAVSHHLKILKEAGIVNMYEEGTMNFYYIDPNESNWKKIIKLMENINTLVKEVAEKRIQGKYCCKEE